MYFAGIVLFLAFLIGLGVISSPIAVFMDLPSLIVIFALSFSMLTASGMISDFLKGFRLMSVKVNPYSAIELKRILQANKLAIRSFLLSGATGTLVGAVSLLANMGDPGLIGKNLAMALITVLYSLIFVFLVLPIQAKANTILDTME